MNIIITGGAGFIGSHVCELFFKKGYQITIIDNLITGKLDNLSQNSLLKFINKDINLCQAQDFSQPIDAIVHLAATPSVNTSWLKPLPTHHNNLSSTLAVIELCKALEIPKLVFASSAAVYGNPIELPIRESHPTQPLSPYGLQKYSSEQYLNLFAKEFNFSVVNLRFFNAFGPRQDPNSPYSGVISIFVNAMKKNLPITIFGDGQQTRDFVYVKDITNAIFLALSKPLRRGDCLTCNVGSGQKTSLLELISILKHFFPQWTESVKFVPARLGDIPHSQSDISMALSQLDYLPSYSLKSGLSFLR